MIVLCFRNFLLIIVHFQDLTIILVNFLLSIIIGFIEFMLNVRLSHCMRQDKITKLYNTTCL
jgi:hypothetical protein